MSALPERPISVLVAALGGEGGGVLADWIIGAARSLDYPVQSTSIPGVAQRTGATTYYLELYPAPAAGLGARRPVMTLAPAPGQVDVLVASELLEAARAMLAGYVTAERTTLVASTHRVYTVAEKMQMGDGRFDSGRILHAARSLCRHAFLFDMQSLAIRSGSVINAVLFGALAGSGALPLERTVCEQAIRRSGKGVEASLRGFELGFTACREGAAHSAGEPVEGGGPPPRPRTQESELLDRIRRNFPEQTRPIVEAGLARVAEYQDRDYADLYLNRLEPIARLDGERGGAATGFKLTSETARFLALWMCYEDVLRVADLKSRRSRFERVRAEVRANPHEPVHVFEYLKPGIEEFAALLPARVSKWALGWAQRRGLVRKLSIGLRLKTTSVTGFLLLRLLASARPLRRLTARYGEEQALIERWLRAVAASSAGDLALGLEVARCGRLIKGYGDTHRRGKASFVRILESLVEEGPTGDEREPVAPTRSSERAQAIRQAIEAALADPEGRSLERALSEHGIAPRPPQAKPVRFFRRATEERTAA